MTEPFGHGFCNCALNVCTGSERCKLEFLKVAVHIKATAHATEDTYVVTKNHYLGKGIVNATEIASLLKDSPVAAPQILIEHYPRLRDLMVGGNANELPLFQQLFSMPAHFGFGHLGAEA